MRAKQLNLSPTRWLSIGFLVIALIGGCLLSLPIASENGSLSFLDALFTATSAVCVTGLTVVDTASQFSLFGELIILFLIQIGGLGFMTFAVLIAVFLGKKLGLKDRLLIQESTRSISSSDLVRLIFKILLIAFSLELLATLILTFHWYSQMGWGNAFYYGLFHAISAFNNAGFALWLNNLIPFVSDPVVNTTISLLFILGGIGFPVILDVWKKRSWKKLSLNSKIALISTLYLIIAGILFIFIIESFNPLTLGKMNIAEKGWAAYFQGVSPRTAGFNTLDIGHMLIPSQFFIILLMFIGASPGGTGGGIKTITFVVLMLTVWNIIRGKKDVQLLKRRIPQDIIFRALAVILISIAILLMVTLLLTITEKHSFLALFFETVSAFGTVGLTMGITAKLSSFGKCIIMFTMFAGRLGPLTIAFALAQLSYSSKIRYPEEKVLIG